MDRLQVSIVRAIQHDWREERVPREIENAGLFDRILLDAPCTNTGVIRRRVDVRWRLQREDFIRMQTQQLEIGRGVARLLKPGGVLVYSTCSMESEENEAVADRLASELPEARLVQKRSASPFRDNCDGAFAAKMVTRAA